MEELEDKDVKRDMDGRPDKCPLCGGGLEDRLITHPHYYEGKIIILENVPAEICRQCGEVLLGPAVVERLQKAVWTDKAPKRTAQVPVYDIEEIS